MKNVLGIGCIAVSLLLVAGCHRAESQVQAVESLPAAQSATTTLMIDREDVEMQTAIRTARREVDNFLIALHEPAATHADFAVKAAFSEDDRIEHMWLVELRYESGLIIGKLANHPELLAGYEEGGTYAVAPEEISDWYYYDGSEMVGGYTVKLLMDRGIYR